jgi:hypothetical protein
MAASVIVVMSLAAVFGVECFEMLVVVKLVRGSDRGMYLFWRGIPRMRMGMMLVSAMGV